MALSNNPTQLDVVKAIKDLEKNKLDTTTGVTLNTEQTITAQKTHDANIMLKNNKWLVNEQGRNLICKGTTSGNQTVVGNTFDKTVIASSSRPAITSGTDKEEMAFLSDLPTKTSQLTNDSNFATTSNIPTKTSDLTNDSGFMTSNTVPNNFQPAPDHLRTPTTPTNDSVWTPAKSGWVMFSCTSHANGSEFYLKLDSSTGLMVGCSLGTGGGKMNYNNCPSMTLPVEAGKTYYVHYYGYSAHYYSS